MSQEGRTKEQINLWESEIRKLWAVANERNKEWIQENQAQLKSVSSTLNGIRASNRDLKAATGRHEEALQSQQQLIDQVTSLELQLQQMLRSQRELVDKANVASQSLAQIEASLSPLVNENAEAVRAFDAFRISHNRRIVALERQFGQMQNPAQLLFRRILLLNNGRIEKVGYASVFFLPRLVNPASDFRFETNVVALCI